MKNKILNIGQNIWWKAGWITFNIFVVGNFALSAVETPTAAPSIQNPIATDSFAGLLELILNIVIEIGTPIVVIAIIFVGFKFVMAQGNEGELKKAKQALLYVLIGAAIVIGCRVIVEIIQVTVDQLK